MRLLTTAYVNDYRASIRVHKGNIVVSQTDGKTRIPVEALDAIVLFGGQITTEAIDLCVRHNIRVSALRRSGRIRFTIGGPTHGNVHLRVAQLRRADQPDQAAGIARNIVAAKLQSYRTLIQRWAWDADEPERSLHNNERAAIAERIESIPRTVDGDTIRGHEGDGTRRYFKCLGAHLANRADLGYFLLRSRRPPRDPTNALLSFLYGVIEAESIGALETVGLDPQVGYLHGLRPGRPSLALDLMEELRPAIADRLAVRLLTRRQLRLEHFTKTGAGATYLTEQGRAAVLQAIEGHRDTEIHHPLLRRPVPVWSLPLVQATILARHIRGDLPTYAPFILV